MLVQSASLSGRLWTTARINTLFFKLERIDSRGSSGWIRWIAGNSLADGECENSVCSSNGKEGSGQELSFFIFPWLVIM